MKKITVSMTDGTDAELVEDVCVNHLSDLGEGVKQAVDDFATSNDGVVLPPITIKAKETQPGENQ
jgi:hypothetical protein